MVPVPGAHAGLALHEVGDHLKLLEIDSIDNEENNQNADSQQERKPLRRRCRRR